MSSDPILLVDDEADLRGNLKEALTLDGYLVEDAAEALGATYTQGPFRGRQVGTLGRIGCFSFNGNKIMTTGGGGMLVTADPELPLHRGRNAGEPAAFVCWDQACEPPVRKPEELERLLRGFS